MNNRIHHPLVQQPCAHSEHPAAQTGFRNSGPLDWATIATIALVVAAVLAWIKSELQQSEGSRSSTERFQLPPPMRQRSGAPLNPPELISLRKTGQAMASDFGNPDEQAENE
jgi:hypothetical protein